MADLELVSHPEAVTPAWLTQVLRTAGALRDGSIVDLALQPVGTGQMGDSVRYHLTYDDTALAEEADPPTTVVGKFPSADETSRATGAATRTYEVEHHFYSELRDKVDITTPRPYLTMLDLAANEFVIIMNDLAPAEQGDQMAGCSADEAAIALEEIAKLHAPVWGEAWLEGLPWLNRFSPEGVMGYTQLITMLWPGFLERYDGRVDPDVVAVGHEVIGRLHDVMSQRPEPHTATHGDFRLDNMLFGTPEGGAPLTTVDWQTVALGPGLADVSYFLGTSVHSDLRAAEEQDLVKEYHRTLQAGGVRDFSWEACWDGYRRFAFSGFLMAVSASMIVGQTERGDEMFMAMANRSGRMGLELETMSLL